MLSGPAILPLAIRELAREAADCGVWPDAVAVAFSSVKNIAWRGKRAGHWAVEGDNWQIIDVQLVNLAKIDIDFICWSSS